MPRSHSGIIGPCLDSQQNVFNVHYLGRSSMSNYSTMEGTYQSSLFDMYTKFKTKRGTKKLTNAKLVLSNRGLSVINWTYDEEFYSLSCIIFCKAVVFTGSKTKVNGTKYYKFSFENLAEVGKGTSFTTAMPKTFKYLLKVKKHSPLVICILRREIGPKVLEVHAFVCNSSEQAMSLSLSVDMARSVYQNEERKNSSNFNCDPYAENSIQFQTPCQDRTPPDDQGNSKDADLPQVMNMLKQLGGGRGSVVNPVIKTSNFNLINDDFYIAPNMKPADRSQRNKYKSQSMDAACPEQSRVYQLNQQDLMKPADRSSRYCHTRAISFDHLNHLSVYHQQKASDKYQAPIQRSKSIKNGETHEIRQSKVDHPQKFVSNNPSGGLPQAVEKPSKPVAMVQPRKIGGIKVFPFGHDRTGLIPDKDKLKKKKNSDDSKYSTPTHTPDATNLYSPGVRNPWNNFVSKSTTEEQMRKMSDDVTLEFRK